jgi:hypothetical protein
MADHKRGEKKGKFCAVAGTPCECGNDYFKVCKPGWAAFTFPRLVKAAAGAFTFPKRYEAHHIVCVAPVSAEIVGKTGISGIIRVTKWCINEKKNMLAMPLWGHSVMWYCLIKAAGGKVLTGVARPAFANIPQHDWDHPAYSVEVTNDCKRVAKDIKDAGHQADSADIQAELDGLSKKWKAALKARGNRDGGTHACWRKGMKNPDSDWTAPFSMASTAQMTKKGFPIRNFDDKTDQWIERIAKAIKGGP